MKIKLIPKTGLQVKIPGRKYLDETGIELELSTLTPYWLRRIADGDVIKKPLNENTLKNGNTTFPTSNNKSKE